MVERPVDSIGPSPIIKGEEKQKWDLCVGVSDLVDARLCATHTPGPLFTRQAWYGSRFDQSKLDRFYLSGGGEWLYHIRSVEHQGARTLSDHVPISLEVVVKESHASTLRKRSYFKMDFKMLNRAEVLIRTRTRWLEHPNWARDKRKGWSLALGRIRKLLMEVREDDKRRVLPLRSLEEHVEELESGEVIEEHEEILEEVHRYYQELYKAEEETTETLVKREEVVSRIDKQMTEEDNRKLEEVPSDEFITRIVMEMPKEKSPGIDGVMVEILTIGWEFMREDCFSMVQSFWDKKRLVGKDSRRIIKLIPKNDRKHLLKNWRPITLLTMTYKIVAKIIAVRLKSILPRLIDTQQTGFVAGRNIIHNILSLRLGQEWAQVTNQDTIFVKLDFMKAYDRVAHGFLWDTLAKMGMGEETVQRIQGLVVGGSSEIHLNGDFTEEIRIERGVRQGCPLAPLLFAMTTQPLMRALREEEAQGNIQGLNIGEGYSLLHQLFADDTGICITAVEEQFVKLKEVIRDFEIASGACLNLQKSIVMQMRPGPSQTWMEESGCEVAGPGRRFVYLGVSTSTPVDEKLIAEEIVQKLMRKLQHWSNRLLSWPSKTILLRHMLAATPLYQLLSVGLSKDSLEALERLCMNFLWGWNEEGNPKTALIAWERIAQSKNNGGLGWTKFKEMSDALNVRLVSRILEGGNVEWIHLARSFILRTLRRGSYQRECRQWSIHESLILLPLTKIAGSPTLTRILGSWFRARKQLEWNRPNKELDGRMT
ncbi:hypothetical protein R1sor_009897 [Riccia sorocarpa]|uniref:Reverse transcriptase domain-containing protein n=1 Tax=Riccia sorocarpa TaxID=122646 RepID=A0ABD3HXV8_9MARC